VEIQKRFKRHMVIKQEAWEDFRTKVQIAKIEIQKFDKEKEYVSRFDFLQNVLLKKIFNQIFLQKSLEYL
jgi:hypothetical protein